MSQTAVKRGFRFGKRNDMDMTTGSIAGKLITFAIPLLLGNLFQQLYNMVDTWVIGQTKITEAYAAVGNVGPITNILIGFFMGLSTGAGVVISQYFGSKNYEKVKKAVHTAAALTIVASVVFTIVGVVFTPLILKIMLHEGSESFNIEVYNYAKTYLTIYFSGVSAMMIYNMCSGILRAIGDSNRPFYFLCVAAAINVGLDFLLVFGFKMNVAGVALATIISQGVSALLSVIALIRTDTAVKLSVKQIKFEKDCLQKILKIGLPAGVQTSLTAFSNVFVQSYITGANGPAGYALTPETVQAVNMSAWTTYSKIDSFFFLPMQSMSLSMTTFTGQNLGINNVERARKGTRIAWLICVCTVVMFMIPVMIFAPFLARFFQADEIVVAIAVKLLRTLTPFYFFSCINQTLLGTIRGAGNSTTPMIIMLANFVGMRQLYLYIMTNFISNDLLPVGLGYPFGWICCAISMLVYYKFFFNYSKYRITDKENK